MNIPTLDNDFYIFTCPQCGDYVMTHKNEIACTIYRHAVFKINFQQIGPHTSKQMCDLYKENDEVFGCSKPFRFYLQPDNSYKVDVCDYI